MAGSRAGSEKVLDYPQQEVVAEGKEVLKITDMGTSHMDTGAHLKEHPKTKAGTI